MLLGEQDGSLGVKALETALGKEESSMAIGLAAQEGAWPT